MDYSGKNLIEQIRLPLINNYIKLIRSLASYGRNYYQKYLIQPLSTWSKTDIQEEVSEILAQIEQIKKTKKFDAIPVLYKKAITKSVAPDQFDMSLPGNVALSFLKEMKENADIALSTEAKQFVSILYKPFKDFSDYQFKKANQQFKDEIGKADDEKVVALAEISRAEQVDIEKEKAEAERKFKAIERHVKTLNSSDLKKNIMAFLLQVATPKDPKLHHLIFPLMKRVEPMNPGFFKDTMDSLAVLIYFEVVKSIKSNDLKKTLKLISKYTVLFRGNPSTPNYNEIDSFEKNFFSLIDARNLWDSI